MVERYVRDVEAAGSNPVASTTPAVGMTHHRRFFIFICFSTDGSTHHSMFYIIKSRFATIFTTNKPPLFITEHGGFISFSNFI